MKLREFLQLFRLVFKDRSGTGDIGLIGEELTKNLRELKINNNNTAIEGCCS